MIRLYSWPTSNGRKVSIMLEECGLDYVVTPIDIDAGAQFSPEFLAVNPNGKIPAIVDEQGPDGRPMSLFESGAILIYLAEKTGRFLSTQPRGRYETLQWLMFQMGGIGPIFGQTHHFLRAAPERVPYAEERYKKETARLYGVLDRRLASAVPGDTATHNFLAKDYSIADIATFPWVARHEWHGIDLSDYPSVRRWFDHIAARPAVIRGMAVPPAAP